MRGCSGESFSSSSCSFRYHLFHGLCDETEQLTLDQNVGSRDLLEAQKGFDVADVGSVGSDR